MECAIRDAIYPPSLFSKFVLKFSSKFVLFVLDRFYIVVSCRYTITHSRKLKLQNNIKQTEQLRTALKVLNFKTKDVNEFSFFSIVL